MLRVRACSDVLHDVVVDAQVEAPMVAVVVVVPESPKLASNHIVSVHFH